jgi:hypothetical protein
MSIFSHKKIFKLMIRALEARKWGFMKFEMGKHFQKLQISALIGENYSPIFLILCRKVKVIILISSNLPNKNKVHLYVGLSALLILSFCAVNITAFSELHSPVW